MSSKKKPKKRPGPVPGRPPVIRADRFIAAREAKGWIQAQLAVHSCNPVSMVSDIETGKRDPQLRALLRFCESLGVSADYLIGLSDKP